MTGMLFTLTMEQNIHTLDIPKVLLRMAIIAPHIYAERFALFMASLKNVNSSDPVSFDMQHLAAVVEITVTNETDADLTVKNITFASSDENIVGSYIIDFKGNNVTYTDGDKQYVSKVATLNVTNGDAIAKNGSAKFYIPIKPHIAEAGSKIVINVNGYEKEIPLTKDVTFKAGTVKKIGFKYTYTETLE